MTTAHDVTRTFFEDYAQALLDRDSERLSHLYAVPALVAFPHQSIPVTGREQTRQFFDQGWEQYDGVVDIEYAVDVIASGAHSIWADVTWSHSGRPRERFMYQLLHDGTGWKVGVLTPLGP